MEYITTKEASQKWGISTIRITILAKEGRIPGAQKLGKSWLIPAGASKPQELKASRDKAQKTSAFSFPLYHYRSDWCYIKDSQLSEQGSQLLLAETAVLECRFADAYPILENILRNPEDIYIEIGCLWNIGICCIGLKQPKTFIKIYTRMQLLLTEDFPHRDDLLVILNAMNTYVKTLNDITKADDYNTDVNDQCIPMTFLLIGYANLSKEMLTPGSADTSLLEIGLRFLSNTSSEVVTEMVHFYLLGIYYLRQDLANAEKHAKAAVQIAYESHLYFPLVTYYHYFSSVLFPIIEPYPVDFQRVCKKLTEQFATSFSDFFTGDNRTAIIPSFSNEDYLYIYNVMKGLSNTNIAKILGVNESTVSRRLSKICEKFCIESKKELLEYLHNYI